MGQQRAAEEKESELKLRRQLLDRYERDQKLQQLSAHKKKLQMMKHKRDVEDIIAERAKLREVEQTIKRSEEERRDIIRAEGMRLIQLHAPKLKHYLNTKMATNQEELDLIAKYIQ